MVINKQQYTNLKKYPQFFYTIGKTTDGKKFRPSDWADRFCGVLSSYRPKNSKLSKPSVLAYSPYAQPQLYRGEKVVLIDREIEKIELLAWRFVTNFIEDNKLVFEEKT